MVEQVRAIGRDPTLLAEVLGQLQAQQHARTDELETERRTLDKDLAGNRAELRKMSGQIRPDENNGPLVVRLADLHQRAETTEARAKRVRDQLAEVRRQWIDASEATSALAAFDPVWEALSPREQDLNDGASIVLVASAGKNKGFPGRSTYSGTKAALRSFARTWISELKERKIRTNVLSPGPVDTPMFDEQFPSREGAAEARMQITAMTPLARLARPRKSLPQLCSWPQTKAASSLVSTCRSTAA